MKNLEIRERFFQFFQSHSHRKVLSSPLIPAKDPTLLFTNAGMNQFKGLFLQQEKRDYRRAVSIQKCMRVSGKHNDFDEVGKTDFHHTFFEMMGNFSFGDYFKEQAIEFAWELLTGPYGLPEDRLWITVFREDDEAHSIWEKKIGISGSRILRLDEKDNFWQMGETGPCGPCSEIHYDRGSEFGPEGPAEGNRRYVEIWNLVFMQYFRDEKGVLHPLPAPSIDTGMGMERLSAVLQHRTSNYQTDLFRPLLEHIADIARISPDDPDHRIDFNVIADHCRALTFLLSDGVIPANDGRGYVLRRILRRALKHGKAVNLPDDFLVSVCNRVVEIMSPFYPELPQQFPFIHRILHAESERFTRTLLNGLRLFEEIMQNTSDRGENVISGQEIFKLADTYGFPADFARDLAMEKNLGIDFDGFAKELEKQRERSRASMSQRRRQPPSLPGSDRLSSVFTGYDELESEAEILTLYIDGENRDKVEQNQNALAVFDRTPFYGESGGQIGDTGSGKTDHGYFEILDTKKLDSGLIVHEISVKTAGLAQGEKVRLEVNRERRLATAAHHSATHLLHAALREVLGPHVKQSGSFVGPDKLRFDFTHFQPLSREEWQQVERLVNQKIRENIAVSVDIRAYEEALKAGATALFDEKYGDIVRMVRMGDFSHELCGGTHLSASGEIGLFVILSESSIASGIRRIEALAGSPAVDLVQKHSSLLHDILVHFNQKTDTLLPFLHSLEKRLKQNEKQKEALGTITIDIDRFIQENTAITDPPTLVGYIEAADGKKLGQIADEIKTRLKGVAVLFSNGNERASLVVSVHPDLTKRFPANIIINQMAALIHGRGGGRADFAQAGGEPIRSHSEFKEKLIAILKETL